MTLQVGGKNHLRWKLNGSKGSARALELFFYLCLVVLARNVLFEWCPFFFFFFFFCFWQSQVQILRALLHKVSSHYLVQNECLQCLLLLLLLPSTHQKKMTTWKICACEYAQWLFDHWIHLGAYTRKRYWFGSHPRASHGGWPIATPSTDYREQQRSMSTHPSLGFWPIAASPNGLHELHWHMSSYPRDSLGFSPIVRPPNGLYEQHQHSTSPLASGTALASRPLQHLQMAATSSIGTCPLIPGTAMPSSPLYHIQMAPLSKNGGKLSTNSWKAMWQEKMPPVAYVTVCYNGGRTKPVVVVLIIVYSCVVPKKNYK